MTIAYLAIGKTRYSPVNALQVAAANNKHLLPILITWCQTVSPRPDCAIDHGEFVRLVYQLYELVYKGKTPSAIPTHLHPPATMTGTAPLPSSFPIPLSSLALSPQYLQAGFNSQVHVTAGSNLMDTAAPSSSLYSVSPGPNISPTFVPSSSAEELAIDSPRLIRRHGKKIAAFHLKGCDWLLAEDVHKTYFSKTSADEFIQKLKSNNNSKHWRPLSVKVADAFRKHYDMEHGEVFELNYMLTLAGLDTVVAC